MNNTFLLWSFWLRLFLLLLLLGTFLRISIRLPLLALLIIINLDLLACALLRALQPTRSLLIRCNILVLILHLRISFLILVLVFIFPFRSHLLLSFARFFLLLFLLQPLVPQLDARLDVCCDRSLQHALLADFACLQLRCILKRSSSRESFSRRIIKLIDHRARARRNRAGGWGIGSLLVCACQLLFDICFRMQTINNAPIPPVPRLILLRCRCLQLDFPSRLVLRNLLGRNLDGGVVVARDRGWRS